jgi:Domain of unknown function (DUF4468) with TBP-like fold
MKKALLILPALLLSVFSYCQDSTAKMTYSEVVKVDSVTKSELYIRARSWFATTYNSAKSVIQMDDKEAGEIVGRGAFQTAMPLGLGVKATWFVQYTLTVFVKDGKYKYDFAVTGMECPDSRNAWSKDYNYYLTGQFEGSHKKASISEVEQVQAQYKSLIASLEKAMTTKASSADF